jgi:rubrerythrin
MFTTEDILSLAIQIEENGRHIYREALQKTDDSTLILLLSWLIEEEDRHIKWFSTFKDTIEPPVGDPKIAQIGQSILLDTLGEMSFSLKETDFSKIQHAKQLIGVAMAFERDKAQFFEMLQPFIQDTQASEYLKRIIGEEGRHILRMQQFIDNCEPCQE